MPTESSRILDEDYQVLPHLIESYLHLYYYVIWWALDLLKKNCIISFKIFKRKNKNCLKIEHKTELILQKFKIKKNDRSYYLYSLFKLARLDIF